MFVSSPELLQVRAAVAHSSNDVVVYQCPQVQGSQPMQISKIDKKRELHEIEGEKEFYSSYKECLVTLLFTSVPRFKVHNRCKFLKM